MRAPPAARGLDAQRLFDGAAPGYDRWAAVLSYGQYGRWRDALVAAASTSGLGPSSRALDLATGTGQVAARLAAATGARVVGLDLSPGMLRAARRRSLDGRAGSRPSLLQGTAERLPFRDASFDAVTFTYLLRYVEDPAATLAEVARVAQPGAFVGFVEFHLPRRAWRPLWKAHTRLLLPLAGRLVSPGWKAVGDFLGPSIERFWRGRTVEDVAGWMRAAGLRDVASRLPSLGGGLVMWGRKEER